MIYSELVEICNRHSNQPALSQGNTRLPYSNLLRLVDRSSNNLNNVGITSGNRVMVIGKNSIQLIALFFALAKNGNMLILVDPNSTQEEINSLFEISKTEYIIYQRSFEICLPTSFKSFPRIESNALDEFMFCGAQLKHPKWWHKISKASKGENQQYVKKKKEDFLILFSSGSTGKPKGIRLSQSALYYQFLYWRNHVQLNSNDKILSALTISHSHGLMLVFPSLLSGSHVHLIQAEQISPEFVCQYCSEHCITMLSGIPLLYHLLLNQDKSYDNRLESIRYAFCGSAPMSKTMAESFYKKYGVHIRQAYGLSETGPVCVNMFHNNEYDYQLIGKVIDGYEYKIVDENGNRVTPGDEGELIIRSKANAEGFLNAKDDAQKMFKADGWLYTQDIVKEDEMGRLTILGRKTSFINVSGFKVHPAEVEKVLLSLSGIQQAAVIGKHDEKLGQVVHAYVVVNNEVDEHIVRKHCIVNLSSFKVPKQIYIVKELPTNSIGKVKYNELT